MVTTSDVDLGTLGWVKDEIDETLKHARVALEGFAENYADEAKLRLCASYLHQIGGTLKMVELDGPAQLVAEAEALAQAVMQQECPASENVLEPLVRALLSLPDLLDRAQTQRRSGIPPSLPLINELRAARGASALDPRALFTPDLSPRPPRSAAEDDQGFVRAFRKERSLFQAALIRWLKDGRASDGLASMQRLVEAWRAHIAYAPLAQCLWVATAFLGLLADQETAAAEHKKLLGRLDQELKRFIEGQDKGSARSGCERITREMLFEISVCPSDNMEVQVIREAFGLQIKSLPLATPTIDALRSIASALRQEITTAQELLSQYFDLGGGVVGQMDPPVTGDLLALLDKLAKTFSTLSVKPISELLEEMIRVCKALEAGQLDKSTAVAMSLAQGLVEIESAARDIPLARDDWQISIAERRRVLQALGTAADTSGMEVSEVTLTEQDRRQLIGAVGGEIRVNLGHLIEHIEAFVAKPDERALLAETPMLLAQVEGAFEVVSDREAADLARLLYTSLTQLAQGPVKPGPALMEAVAVGIGALEAQVVGLERGRPLSTEQFGRIQSALQIALTRAEQGEDVYDPVAVSKKAPVVWEPEGIDVVDDLALASDPGSAPVVMQLHHDLPADIPVNGAGIPLSMDALPPAIDPEILPVFLEDAHEALRGLGESFGPWQADHSDEQAMIVIRRAFHTLKGSGRMVEAGEIAELAYDAEFLLNRLRGRQIPVTEECVRWIGLAFDHVRDWVQAVEQGKPLPYMASTRQALQALANNTQVPPELEMKERGADNQQESLMGVSRSDSAALDVPFVSSMGDASPSDQDPKVETTIPSFGATNALSDDPLLRDIFLAETRDHLMVLDKVVEVGGAGEVSAEVLRAAHTMQGSARSVGLLVMAEACADLEHYLQALEIRRAPLGQEGVALLRALIDACRRLLASLPDQQSTADGFIQVGNRLRVLLGDLSPDRVPAWWQKHLNEESSGVDGSPGKDAPSTPVPPDPAVTPLSVVQAEETSSRKPSHNATAAVAEPMAARDTDDIDPELRDIFRDEARDLLDAFETALALWRKDLQDEKLLQSLKRVLHTLKGGARMTGALAIGELSHATEDLLRRVEEGACSRDNALVELLDEVAGRLGVLYTRFVERRAIADADSEFDLIARLKGEPGAPATAPLVVDMEDEPKPSSIEPEEEMFRAEVATQVRVRTALLDRLVNYAGEVSIARSRMEQQVFRLREHLAELDGNVRRFRDQLRELEIQAESQIVFRAQVGVGNAAEDFDPLEFDRYSRLQQLSRGLTENLHDLITLHGTLDNVASQAEAVLQQQARVNTELQEGLMRTRMVSFATQSHRLRQIVRQTSQELNKKAELILSGADVELDRHLLERMVAPFEHMIRNAIDHGLESASERARLGKPPVGRIVIDTAHESGEIVVRFSDDGAGLDIARIKQKALERKLVASDVALTDEQIMQFILLPGFSTATRITHLSGRGVGMDVVHSEVKKLGGAITVETQRGQGTTFIIRLPLTLSIAQALMVGCADQLFAIPLAAIINIVEAPATAIDDALALSKPVLRYSGKDYPFMDLGMRLGLPRPAVRARKSPVLLLRLDAREVAVAIDSLAGTREVVVKPLGPQLTEIRGLFGATILGDGRVVLILDIPALWTEGDAPYIVSTPVDTVIPVERPLVLVVDDSLTVRKVTSRTLQKYGFDVTTAKDGIEALEQIRERVPDVMLVDIEMPRMDGYELTSRIRDDAQLKTIPIIMITSRSGDKHRERAMSLGVDVYLGKPYQEDDLRKHVEAVLSRPRI